LVAILHRLGGCKYKILAYIYLQYNIALGGLLSFTINMFVSINL